VEGSARIEPGSLRKLLQASKNWDAAARREMRAGLRAAALKSTEAAKTEVLGPPPGGGAFSARTTGLRQALASGTKVSIRGGREGADGAVKGEGVRVVVAGNRLPAEQQAMVKAYMAREWRHPVYGGRLWVEQRGKNWFYGPLMAGREEYQRNIVKAINDAADAVARG
jgi:hypothetical protein